MARGHLSPYGWTLLAIFYLQALSPDVHLLQMHVPRNVAVGSTPLSPPEGFRLETDLRVEPLQEVLPT